MPTVEQLRQSGYKVRVHHTRLRDLVTGDISPRGGSTRVEITSPEGETFVGESQCSLKDNFNKAIANLS